MKRRRRWRKASAVDKDPLNALPLKTAMCQNFYSNVLKCKNINFTDGLFEEFLQYTVDCSRQIQKNSHQPRSDSNFEFRLEFLGCKFPQQNRSDFLNLFYGLNATSIALSVVNCTMDYYSILDDNFFFQLHQLSELEIDARAIGYEVDMMGMSDETIDHWLNCLKPPSRLQLWNVRTNLSAQGFRRLYENSVAVEESESIQTHRKSSQTYVKFTEEDEFGTVSRRWWNHSEVGEREDRLNPYDFRNYAFDLVVA